MESLPTENFVYEIIKTGDNEKFKKTYLEIQEFSILNNRDGKALYFLALFQICGRAKFSPALTLCLDALTLGYKKAENIVEVARLDERGDLFARSGKLDDAYQSYENARSVNQRFFLLNYKISGKMCRIALSKGQLELVVKNASKGLTFVREVKGFLLFKFRGIAAFRLKDFAQAQADFSKCLMIKSTLKEEFLPRIQKCQEMLTKQRKMAPVNFYKILDVPVNAGNKEITKAFKILTRSCHPDLAPEGKKVELTKKFQQINEAKTVLLDPRKRMKHDMAIRAAETTTDTGGFEEMEPGNHNSEFNDQQTRNPQDSFGWENGNTEQQYNWDNNQSSQSGSDWGGGNNQNSGWNDNNSWDNNNKNQSHDSWDSQNSFSNNQSSKNSWEQSEMKSDGGVNWGEGAKNQGTTNDQNSSNGTTNNQPSDGKSDWEGQDNVASDWNIGGSENANASNPKETGNNGTTNSKMTDGSNVSSENRTSLVFIYEDEEAWRKLFNDVSFPNTEGKFKKLENEKNISEILGFPKNVMKTAQDMEYDHFW